MCDCVWKDDKRHGACRYTFFNGEVYACTFVDGVCAEFDARQAAVRAAPDAASAQARAEGYASAAAKAEAQAAAKAEAIATARAKAPRTVELLLRLDMQDHIPNFMSARLALVSLVALNLQPVCFLILMRASPGRRRSQTPYWLSSRISSSRNSGLSWERWCPSR